MATLRTPMATLRTWQSLWLFRMLLCLVAASLASVQISPAYGMDLNLRRETARQAAWHLAHMPHVQLALGLTQTPDAALREKIAAKERAHASKPAPDVRPLTLTEMGHALGRGPLRNSYFNGTLPWQKSLRDVNLCNGDLYKSFTDIQVAPARGAGLAFQRTYNSNEERVGPFGLGWTHAYDIRVQEAAQVTAENGLTPKAVDVNMVPRTDFFGHKHSYHRDADGLYTPPTYLYDETSSDYGNSLVSGPPQVMDDTEKGMDGTLKHYKNVVTNADGSSGNERACDYIQDRYGNTTTLTYGQSYVQADGSTRQILTQVTDPIGRSLTFQWTNFGTTLQPAYRITETDAPTDPTTGTLAYRVTYAYYGASDPNAGGTAYQLKSVTLDPDGLNRTTTYTYTSCSGTYYDSSGNPQTATEYGLLASVSDPLGHTVSYTYSAVAYVGNGNSGDAPQGYVVPKATGTIWVSTVTEPAGVDANSSPRTQTWTILPVSGSQGFNVVTTSSSGAYLYIEVDSQLRFQDYYGEPLSSSRTFTYSADGANNVIKTHDFDNTTYGPNMGAAEFWVSTGCDVSSTYGQHSNVLTQSTASGGSGNSFPEQTTTTYYNALQYFQQQSVTDGNGHTTLMGVGTSTAGTPGDADTNGGDRGQTLWVQDAGYTDSASPSYHKQFIYTYNAFGQKLSETNLNGVVTQYYYGGDGSSFAQADTDADDAGNLIAVVQDPGGAGHLSRTTTMRYDIMGRVLQSTDPSGQTSTFGYNSLGQPLTVSTPAKGNALAETISYTYDGNGRTHSVTDNRGATTMAYESGCDRVSSVTDPVTGTVSYTYRATGERLTMTLPGGGTWNYAYSDTDPSIQGGGPYPSNNGHYNNDGYGGPSISIAGRYILGKTDDLDSLTLTLDRITDDQGRRVDYMMDGGNRLLSAWSDQAINSGGSVVSYLQSANHFNMNLPQHNSTDYRLSSARTTWHTTAGNGQFSLVNQNDYTYDGAGNRKQNTISNQFVTQNGAPQHVYQNPVDYQVVPSRTETYTYDDVNRLSAVNYGDGQTQSYGFDPMGNRLQKTDSSIGTTNSTFDTANRLTATAGTGASTYASDADGNTLTGGGRTNTWDSQNRLVTCAYNGNITTNTYGADGLRRSSTVGGVTTYYVYDGQILIREMHRNTQTNALFSTATYLTGPRGPEYRRDDTQLEMDSQQQQVSKTRWYLYDGLGSVIGEVNPSGNMTSSPKYDVYGLVRSNNGTASSNMGFVGGVGHLSEANTGLIYMRARYYDPNLGRFNNEDPSKNGRNWFAYCEANPVNGIDANGKNVILIYIGISALVSGALSALSAPDGSKWAAFIRGFIEGAIVSAATCLPGAWGIAGGAAAGGVIGFVDALMTGGNPYIGGIVGAFGGGIGGVASVEAAAEARSVLLYLVMAGCEGCVVSDVNSAAQFFG